jgi:DNA modification methylase
MTKNQLQLEYVAIDSLQQNKGSARRHSKVKIRRLADSFQRLGFNVPVLVDKSNTILSGHARVAAARLVGFDQIPVVRIEHLSDAEAKAFMLAENKFVIEASWDQEVLASTFGEIIDFGIDPAITGFSLAEVDLTIDAVEEAKPKAAADDGAENQIPQPPETPVSRRGDLWLLGRHKLLCGDAREAKDYKQLLKSETAHIMFADPPFNLKIPGHVSGLGKVKHENFAMASGEMSEAEFTAFLTETLGLAASRCKDGAIAYVCMDFRHMGELIAAGKQVFSELKNLCVWDKGQGGMGAFYRSQHELVFTFKVGTAPHTNNFGLGDTGRYRTNVWAYRGVSSMSATRSAELAMHPTVKPVALVADALRDCSKRGEIVLDPFGGSGSTLIAAEKTGRLARLIEYEPRYCDVIISRFERVTGKQATLASTGETFEDVAEARATPDVGEVA